MRTRTRYSIAALCAAVLVLLGIFFTAERAQAQCANITVCNYSPCRVDLCLWDVATGTIWCAPITLPANTGAVPPLPPYPPFPAPPPAGCSVFPLPVGFVPGGVRSQAGVLHPWAATGFMTPSRWVQRIRVGPSGCCVDVYYDPASCRIWIYPHLGPIPCNP